MNNAFKLGTAATAAVLVGFVVSNLVPGTARTAVATPSARVDRASIVGAIQSEYLAGLAADWYTPTSTAAGTGPLAAGRYHIDVRLHNYRGTTVQPDDTRGAGGEPFPGALARVSFDVPAGWKGEGGWAILKGDEGTPSGLAMAPVTIDRVYWDSCRWNREGSLADGPFVTTLGGLETALAGSWDGTATRRSIVALAGLDGRYVEVRTPADVDLTTCDEGRYVLFANGDDQRWVQGAGELDQLWLVDVDGVDEELGGGLLVIDAASQPGVSPEDLAELQAIVDSIEIEYLGGS